MRYNLQRDFLHAVEDEPQEDEGVVAVVCVQVPHNTLAQFTKVLRFGKLALIHKAGPGPDRFPSTVKPLLCHIPRKAFRKESEDTRREGQRERKILSHSCSEKISSDP